MILPFTLQQLRILKAVAKEKNFTKAAETLYLSQPSLSKQIKTLEKNLDITLLNRKNNKISLTENGKVFLDYSERILALCEESCRTLIDLKNGNRGNLTIGASPTIGIYLMPRIVILFAQNYPQIDLKIKVNSTSAIAKNIANHEIDIALVGGQIPNRLKKNLTIEHFIKDELNLIVPKSHPFTKKKVIKKEDLYHLNFITLNSISSIQKFIETILNQHNIEITQLKVIMQLNSIEGIKTAVSLGLGAAFISSSALNKEIEFKTIEILKIENLQIFRDLYLISNSDGYKSKAFEFFYDELQILKNTLEN
jgi:DNA-binding transcriptional LysR family regulator